MNKKTDIKTALLDIEIIMYRHAAKAEAEGTSLRTLKSMCVQAIDNCVLGSKASEFYLMVSGRANFRKTLYPEYKAPRAKVRRPILLTELRQYLVDEYKAYSRPNLEADDILGILATHSTLVRADLRVIVSIDKDFLGVPCALYRSDGEGVQRITERDADRWHLIQTLTGDTTDNYPGCPGIGPVRAAVLVDKALADADPWQVIVAAFEKEGLTEQDALLQARLARILRADEYDFKAKRPKLWEPSRLKHNKK